jgi:hypothetical protein
MVHGRIGAESRIVSGKNRTVFRTDVTAAGMRARMLRANPGSGSDDAARNIPTIAVGGNERFLSFC